MDKQDLLQDLNPEQLQAVTHKKGPLLVIAGAGTGKTTVLVKRIAYLIEQKLAKPEEILALTFTDKAAEDMEARVDKLVPYGFVDVVLSTFHSFGDRILRDHAIDLGLTSDYRVLSAAEQAVFFRQHIFDFPLNYYKSLSDPLRHIEALLLVISRAQDEDISAQEYIKWARTNKDKKQLEIGLVYKKYQELKMAKGFIDFSDQVGLALRLFRKHPKILRQYQKRFKYILVDEFQDTNYSQFQLLKLIAGKNPNLTVVGDDDQAIYKFRGAAITNILSFEKYYKPCERIVLTRNYRSSQIILDMAYKVIKHNDPDRLEHKAKISKKLIAYSGVPEYKPEHLHYDRVYSEADAVANLIKQKHEAGYKYGDMAILVRANHDAEYFKQALNMLSIAHRSSGSFSLYNMPEVLLLISFLKVIGDPSDSASLYHLALSDIFGLNSLDLQKINTFAQRRNLTLHHVFTHLDEFCGSEVLGDISSKSRTIIYKIMEQIKEYLDLAKEKSTGEVLYLFLKKSGILSALSQESENKIKNIARFFEKVRQFKDVAKVDRVAEFVKYFDLMREAGDNPETINFEDENDAVNILTVHKAKGLEFKIVFIVSMVADKFPARSRKNPIELPDRLLKESVPKADAHLQEERRLFYVAMTRAKEELYITSANDYGGKKIKKLSLFVLEAFDFPSADVKPITRSALDQIELFAPKEIVAPNIKLVQKDELLKLSFYQIDDYLTCPLKYKFVHLLNVPLLPNHAIIYGSALHKAAQAYDQAKLNHKSFSQKDLIGVLLRNWSSEGFISRQHEEQRLAKAQQALKQFYKDQKRSKRKIISVEDSFSVIKDKVNIRGRFDKVESENNKIYIVDFKSSEVLTQDKADKKAKESLQLAIYALAWQAKNQELPFAAELYFIESGLIGVAQKTDKDIAKVWEKIHEVEEGIKSSNFKATPNSRNCSYCAYNGICSFAIR